MTSLGILLLIALSSDGKAVVWVTINVLVFTDVSIEYGAVLFRFCPLSFSGGC